MRLRFEVDGVPAIYTRGWFSGRASLRVGDQVYSLAKVLDPTTHFDINTTKAAHVNVLGHDVLVQKIRPRLFSGVRRQSYEITVDGQPAASATGY